MIAVGSLVIHEAKSPARVAHDAILPISMVYPTTRRHEITCTGSKNSLHPFVMILVAVLAELLAINISKGNL